MIKKFILTIDGPAASGKGALSKILSSDLNLYYLETGIYYRIFAKKMLGKEINKTEIDKIIKNSSINIFEKEIDRKENLYTTEISNLASMVAKVKSVRDHILELQKYYLNNIPINHNGIIMEGRDCGTVIAPNADIKIFLTASLKIRTKRRYEQSKDKNHKKEDIYRELKERDMRDLKRKISPLKKADDAILIDNSDFNLKQTINIVKKLIFSRIPYLKIKK